MMREREQVRLKDVAWILVKVMVAMDLAMLIARASGASL